MYKYFYLTEYSLIAIRPTKISRILLKILVSNQYNYKKINIILFYKIKNVFYNIRGGVSKIKRKELSKSSNL